jgi:hypothetical protein
VWDCVPIIPTTQEAEVREPSRSVFGAGEGCDRKKSILFTIPSKNNKYSKRSTKLNTLKTMKHYSLKKLKKT